ncbi:hypothetical protein EVG20_g985 [Dentipellis fragilis]|uniref:Uncharacterized protein n=1 Tax=Dentipellis fragilis TaxID=205917 RepID=A0A4Y9ZDQ7_9AGAM|nr:hypothetical protein EVG20_g985 [Dentipellis fragilis]
MSSRNVRGAYHAAPTGQPARFEGHQSTQNLSRTTWSEPHCEKLRLEHLAVLAESKAVSDQFFSGLMTVYEYQRLHKRYTARLDALSEELDEELKKETPSTVQRAMDWGYTQEDAEKMWRNLMKQEDFYSNLSRNRFLYRRDVRDH